MKHVYLKVFSLVSIFVIVLVYLNLIRLTPSKQYTLESFQAFLTNQLLVNRNDYFSLFASNSSSSRTFNYNYLNRYDFYLNCKNSNLTKWNSTVNQTIDYTKINKSNHELRISRGLIVYFPTEKTKEFLLEFKWLYRSWIEIQQYEPSKWRTDLVVFAKENLTELNELNCTYMNRRKSNTDSPMCILLQYVPLQKRDLKKLTNFESTKYEHLLDELDVFSDDSANLLPFYTALKENLKDYEYADSILMAFDGYSYFKEANYDFLIRSDMDVFLTPLFSKWIPINCNDFYVGRGGYSDDFNRNRLKRIAFNLGLEYANKDNLGSTWYSTPDQFRLVAYLTLFNMMYLSKEEFTKPEIKGEVGTLLWPYWHYGVLLLYGQHLGLNHLIATNQINVVKLNDMLDYPSANTESINEKIHIHVFHGDDLFSKFAFKNGDYDNYTVPNELSQLNQIKYYCLRMALEAKRVNSTRLNQMLINESFKKT